MNLFSKVWPWERKSFLVQFVENARKLRTIIEKSDLPEEMKGDFFKNQKRLEGQINNYLRTTRESFGQMAKTLEKMNQASCKSYK